MRADKTEFEQRRQAAEAAIQSLLLDLEEFSERRIDHVRVDTRNFANLRVEIFFAEEKASNHWAPQ